MVGETNVQSMSKGVSTGSVPLDELVAICGPDRVITEHAALRTYESDGLLQYAVVNAAQKASPTVLKVSPLWVSIAARSKAS